MKLKRVDDSLKDTELLQGAAASPYAHDVTGLEEAATQKQPFSTPQPSCKVPAPKSCQNVTRRL